MNKRGILIVGILLIVLLPGALAVEKGSYWNRYDGEWGVYNLEVYSGIINYDSEAGYEPIEYGRCGSNCFRDWNGLIYRVSSDPEKAYVKVYDPDDNYLSSFGFGITGNVGGTDYKYSTLNFTWIWSEVNFTTGEYVFRAWNNRTNFNWTQEYHFYPNQSMKIKNKITNNLGVNIQNTKFWYIQTVNESDGIWFNGTRYSADTYKSGEFDALLPKVKFEDKYIFEYDDLLNNSFNITDFYLGNGSVIGVNNIRIMAIGITKGSSVFPDGYSVTVDPTVKIGVSEGGGDAYVASGFPNTNFGNGITLEVKEGSPTRRSYLLFNISAIPDNQVIDNATLCLYIYDDVIAGAETIFANEVYNTEWCEGDGGSDGSPSCEITWSNQPCGESFDNSSACNLTSESNITNDGNQDNTWQCWNVEDMVSRAYSSSEEIAMVLTTNDAGSADKFRSKEYSNSSLWPYLNITYSLSDIFYPEFSNYQESPANGSYYSPGQFYQFNVTLNESNLYQIGIEFNGVNYSVSNVSDVYIFNRTNLAAGTYYYYWWARDIVGNYNTSEIGYYTVSKASPSVSLLLNSVADNLTLTYLQNLNASASTDGGTLHLYRNDVSVDLENSLNKVLGAGYYIYKANVTGNQNYTDSSGIILYANITKANPAGNMLIVLTPSSTVDYGNQTSATASETNTGDSDLTYNLFRDGEGVANPNIVTLNAGIYNYTYSTFGGENYSSGSVNVTLTVNKLGNAVSLLINGIAGNITINSSETINASAYSEGGTISLFRNNSDISSQNSVNIILGAGYYEYFANSSGTVNYKENTSGITFYVNVTPVPDNEPPILSLIYPLNNSYIQEHGVYFNYSVTDQYLDSCGLWLMQNGSWELNQTSTPSNGDNYFALSLGDGNHSWGIICNDSSNRQTNINYTFAIDSVNPDLTLSEPTGKKTSKTGIPLTFTASDINLQSCWYNISYDNGGSWVVSPGKEYVIISNCTSTSFSVSNDYSYLIYLTVNDSAGNMNFSSLSFTVSTSTTPPSNGGGGGGGGIPLVYKLETNNISNIVGNSGDSKRMVLGVKNSGTLFLNECKLKSTGDNSAWISSSGIKGLGAGEEYEFVFELKIPDGLEAGSYELIPTVICREVNKSVSFNVEILERRLKVELVTLEKRKDNQVLVVYTLEELSDVSQQVEVAISLVNEKGETEAEFKDSKTVNAGSKQQFEAVLVSEGFLGGNYNLFINAKSPTSSAFLQEEIVLGSPNIQGLSILDESRKNIVIIVILVSVFAVFAGFILMRILKFRGFKKRTKIKSVTF